MNNLDEIIKQLDNFLYQGYILKASTIKKWDDQDKTGTKLYRLEDYKEDFTNSINSWFSEVANYLLQNFEEKRYFFHFSQRKSDALTITHPLGNLSYILEKHLFALEEIIIRLDEKQNLYIRQEIAEKEYQSTILYEITFKWHNREIRLNEMVLSTPNSDSKSYNFFEYIYSHQNQQLNIKDIEEATSLDLADNIHDILRDLGFVGELLWMNTIKDTIDIELNK